MLVVCVVGYYVTLVVDIDCLLLIVGCWLFVVGRGVCIV